ncbi:hypothetical protein BGZ83_002017 [Gryganskiella cystojenkinii]|nr:hypothetical protein BGZ83_002017 [Gryganskiella cystojenkinii]
MPTFAPVPSSFSGLNHRSQAIYLYRHILREGAHFFDERASHWIRSRAQEVFAKNKRQKDYDRIQKSMSDARKALRFLERANQMDLRSVQRVLRMSYGLLGIERRKLLQPLVDSARIQTVSPSRLAASLSVMKSGSSSSSSFSIIKGEQQQQSSSSSSIPQNITTTDTATNAPSKEQLAAILAESIQQPAPLFYKKKRTIPPIYSDPMETLISNATKKPIHPILPKPLFKPLHGKREANLRWRFFSQQISKLKPPLPAEIRQEMEWKARIGLDSRGNGAKESTSKEITKGAGADAIKTTETSLARKQWEHRILTTIRAWNKNGQEHKKQRFETGRFHPSIGGKPAKPNILTPRLYRRIWQQLLDEVTILDIKVVGGGSESSPGSKSEDGSPKVVYSVSKSPISHRLRTTKSLRLIAGVNDFDLIGMDKNTLAHPSASSKGKRGKKK